MFHFTDLAPEDTVEAQHDSAAAYILLRGASAVSRAV